MSLYSLLAELSSLGISDLGISQSVDSFLPDLGSIFGDIFFKPWKLEIFGKNVFARDRFRGFTDFLAIGISLIAAGLLLLEMRAKKLGTPVPERFARRVGIGMTVVSFFLYFDFFNPNTRYDNYYHRHELYHYYLGSKYFEEIGYQRLYTCTSLAEVELGHGKKIRKREIRDLSARNLIVPTTKTYIFDNPGQCKDHFSDERWAAFKADVKWFERSARGDYWEKMQQDHGYNPPPVWTMVGHSIASLAPAGDTFFKLLASMDIMLQLSAVLLLYWAFGWRTMAMATIFWGCNAPANFYWTGGAFLRQDWIFLVVASLCCARKRKFVLCGIALTWAALLRVFPLVLFGGVGLIMLFQLLRKRNICKDHLQFLGGCVLAAGLLVPASIASTGPNTYSEFAAHIGLHKGTALTNHMGLETILVHNWDGRMVFTRDDRLDDPFEGWKDGRTTRKEQRKPLFLAINAFMLLWLAWTLRRTRQLWIGMALSVPIIISLANVTCYYYSVFIAGAVLARARPALGPAYLALAGASQVLLLRFHWIDDKYTAQSYLFYAFGMCMLWVYSRPFDVTRLKRWYSGKLDVAPAAAAKQGRDNVPTL